MTDFNFEEFTKLLKDTSWLIKNNNLRRDVYHQFNNVFTYLSREDWPEDKLKERHEYSKDAVFQNIAEGYFRLGFVEKAFFEYSKLIYDLWYEKAIEYQVRKKKRIHKGMQLHQSAQLYHEALNRPDKAWDYYLAALIEDIIDGRQVVESQAYRALLRLGLAEKNLFVIRDEVQIQIKKIGKMNPLDIVDSLKESFLIPSYQEVESIDNVKLSRAKRIWPQL